MLVYARCDSLLGRWLIASLMSNEQAVVPLGSKIARGCLAIFLTGGGIELGRHPPVAFTGDEIPGSPLGSKLGGRRRKEGARSNA